jgi:hypothetical protein
MTVLLAVMWQAYFPRDNLSGFETSGARAVALGGPLQVRARALRHIGGMTTTQYKRAIAIELAMMTLGPDTRV